MYLNAVQHITYLILYCAMRCYVGRAGNIYKHRDDTEESIFSLSDTFKSRLITFGHVADDD